MSTPRLADLLSPEGRRRIAHEVQLGALIAVAWLLGRLGVDRASAFMGRAWRLLAPYNKRHARADGHLAAAFPQWDAAKRKQVLGDMWENLGRTAAETILLPRLIAERERMVWDHLAPDVLEKARGGAIFVSLHSGNWEVVSVPIVAAGLDLHAVYKPMRNKVVEEWLVAQRSALYGDGLMAADRSSAVKMKSLAKGGATLAILADLKDDTGIEIDFFGRPCRATPFPAMLARRLGLPLFAGRTIRLEGAHFRIDGRWLDVPTSDDQQADVVALTKAIHAQFEAWIREYPAQWMWAHRKWL